MEVGRVDHTNKVEARFGSAALLAADRGHKSKASPTWVACFPPSARQKFPNGARTRPLPQWMACKKRQAACLPQTVPSSTRQCGKQDSAAHENDVLLKMQNNLPSHAQSPDHRS